MSKINQIQTSLLELSGGDFQKLGDAYLKAKGYDQINSIGSVIGKNKVRKGTPDTLIPLPNGKYVFVEHTTELNIFKKIKKDLEECFDEAKTGIPIRKIQQIIYCHISKSALNTSEIESIREMCQKQGVNIDIFGINTISWDLYEKYPGIAREFLNIEVDTGQIVPPSEFITDYNKNPITTPINTHFQFRETELNQILLKLQTNNLVIITGKAGVGKTRLVLECCEQFVQCFPEYLLYCIRFRGIDIFNDLKVYFSKPGCYIIFVDDANRINNFRYFIDCLNDQREDQQIKIIATVRDYAFDQIKEIAETYNSWNNLEIQTLEEKQIQAIIKHEYNIINHIYVDRIVDISQGNPRLAIMAAQVVIAKRTIESIIDVSSLYDQYYQSIRKDLDVLGNESYLKTAAIISFFRVVDQSNQEKMNIIETVFNISAKDFWSNACELHSRELLDMYEHEIVKTSDQVLANYLFYLAFFDKKIIDFSVLLNNLFPQFKYLLVDVINPIISNFDKNKIKAILRPGVDKLWKKYQEKKEETKLTELIKLFWFLDLTKVLNYVKQSIDQIEMESVEFSSLEIKANNNSYSSPLLEILTLFSQVDQTNLSIALQLLFKYLEKRPTSISSISYLLTEKDFGFGFDHNSYLWDFMVQHTVIDLIIEQVNQDKKLLFSKLFIAVSEKY